MSGAFFFVLFLVVVGFIIHHVVKKTKRRVAEWSLAAQALGLDYIPAGLPIQTGTIHGECRGVWISVALHSERSGRNSTTYTRYVAQYAERLPVELRLTRQGFFHDVASFFGVQDIEVDDPEFDALVIIKGDDEDAVRAFLTPARRREITALYAWFERVSIDSGQIVALALGASDANSELVAGVEALIGASQALAGTAAAGRAQQRVRFVVSEEVEEDLDDKGYAELADELGDEPGDLISQIRQSWSEGRSFLGAPPVGLGRREVFEPYDPPVPTWDSERATDPGIGAPPPGGESEQLELEAVAEPGDGAEGDEALVLDEIGFEETTEEATEEPVPEPDLDQRPDAAVAFAGLSDVASAFAEIAPATGPELAPEPSTLATGSSAGELCDALFGDNASGYEIDSRFASHRGERVVWSGTLDEAHGFDLDFELGSGSGTRAVLEVHEVTTALGTTDPIRAVVRFPEGDASRLDGLVGRRVAFSGRLDKVKGLMKELILLDGELIG